MFLRGHSKPPRAIGTVGWLCVMIPAHDHPGRQAPARCAATAHRADPATPSLPRLRRRARIMPDRAYMAEIVFMAQTSAAADACALETHRHLCPTGPALDKL